MLKKVKQHLNLKHHNLPIKISVIFLYRMGWMKLRKIIGMKPNNLWTSMSNKIHNLSRLNKMNKKKMNRRNKLIKRNKLLKLMMRMKILFRIKTSKKLSPNEYNFKQNNFIPYHSSCFLIQHSSLNFLDFLKIH